MGAISVTVIPLASRAPVGHDTGRLKESVVESRVQSF